MIPNFSKQHVLTAIARIDKEGVPPSRGATKFAVVHDGRSYPPKYVVCLAVEAATGRTFAPHEFAGGPQTHAPLLALGFEIRSHEGKALPRPVGAPPKTKKIPSRRRVAATVALKPAPRLPAAPRLTRPPASGSTTAIGRIVVDGAPPGSPMNAERQLYGALRAWPTSDRVTFLITPGGFAQASFPARYGGGISWESSDQDMPALLTTAEPALEQILSARVLEAARAVCSYLTIGLDLQQVAGGTPEAELVAVVDVVAGKVIRWTGKSYPTSSQEQDLVQVTDLRSHLLELAGERVLVLGCHDLNMWSPRSRANQAQGSRRNIRCTSMIELAAKFKPTIVLQHPHTTDTVRIWSVAWSGIRQSLPSVAHYASGIAYYNRDGACRGRIEAVQSGTKFGNVIDRVLKT